jgi:UPF0755 protein
MVYQGGHAPPFFCGRINVTNEQMDRPAAASTKLSAKSKRRMAFATFMFLICLIAGGVGGVLLFVASTLQPTEPGEEVRFTVPRGVSSGRIANILEREGLIRDSTIFAYYLKYKDIGGHFQAGEYAMAPGMTKERIIEMLNNGEIVKPETFTFTIAEGLTVEQIASLLDGQGNVKKDKLLELAADPSKLQETADRKIPAFVGQIGEIDGLRFKLEGYLFPDTYEMRVESTANEVILRLLQELANKLSGLPEGWEEQLDKHKISFHQMLAIASLIEREVVVDDERAIVSSVIHNRLNKKMNLEIDATVLYAMNEHKDTVLHVDLDTKSPYNTYRNAGLPPGPIANPSLASIKAALYPEETKFFFYVTKKDGTQAHLFAETFKQHQQNIANSSKKTN